MGSCHVQILIETATHSLGERAFGQILTQNDHPPFVGLPDPISGTLS